MEAKEPDQIEFEVGETINGASLRLIYAKDIHGKYSWSLFRDATGQRNDDGRIVGISGDAMRKIIEAVEGQKKKETEPS